MSMRLALIAGFAIGAGLARADPIADGVAAIPGVVEDVRVGGTWSDDGKSGTFRIVVTRGGGDMVTARLFVQWVAFQDAGGATVDHSIEIVELAELQVDVDDFVSESDEDGLSVFIRTIDPSGTDDLTYELFVFSPDEYLFDLATN